jgi:flavin-dependent dehydrogenase
MNKKEQIIENAQQLCKNGSTVAGLHYAYKEGMLAGKAFIKKKLKENGNCMHGDKCLPCNIKDGD